MNTILKDLDEHIKYSLDTSKKNFEWELLFGSNYNKKDLNRYNFIDENKFKKIYDNLKNIYGVSRRGGLSSPPIICQ